MNLYLDDDSAKAIGDAIAQSGSSVIVPISVGLSGADDPEHLLHAVLQDLKTGKPVKTSPVMMSFATDKPFFPYRETQGKDSKSGNRLLRVFFLGDQKMEGHLADTPWQGKTTWADRLEESQIKQLFQAIGFKPTAPSPKVSWLTTFRDSVRSRPGDTDLFFEPATNQDPVRPPDIEQPIIIPAELLAGGLILIWAIFRRPKPPAD